MDYNYVFVDSSGHCFDDLAAKDTGDGYLRLLAHWFKKSKKLSGGDMMAFRDELYELGFKWGEDFYVRKVVEIS